MKRAAACSSKVLLSFNHIPEQTSSCCRKTAVVSTDQNENLKLYVAGVLFIVYVTRQLSRDIAATVLFLYDKAAMFRDVTEQIFLFSFAIRPPSRSSELSPPSCFPFNFFFISASECPAYCNVRQVN